MFFFRVFIHSILLCTMPFLAAYSITEIPAETVQAYQDSLESPSACTPLSSYNNTLQLLDALESGELEKMYSDEVLDKLNPFLALLATEGALPEENNEGDSLEDDIQELLYGDSYSLSTTPLSGQGEFLHCRSWTKKQWDQTKKFVRKHKKEIIIGAVVVVVVATVVCAVVIAGSAAGATAAASGAAGAMGGCSSDDEKDDAETAHYIPTLSKPSPTLSTEESIVKEVIQEQIVSFKEAILKNELLAAHFEEDPSGDGARKVASFLAHETFSCCG